MSAPVSCTDPFEYAINRLTFTMKALWTPTRECPPVGGGSTVVAFVPGEGEVWDPLGSDGCDPFLWIRIVTRYRTTAFPEAETFLPCGGIPVLALEVGVGRCAPSSLEAETDWTQNAIEAEIGLDDSNRLDKLLCGLRSQLDKSYLLAADPIVPTGPDGGAITWTTVLYIGLTTDSEE